MYVVLLSHLQDTVGTLSLFQLHISAWSQGHAHFTELENKENKWEDIFQISTTKWGLQNIKSDF